MDIMDRFKAASPQSRSLIFSIALTGLILVVETAAGFMTNSLALLSDAAHVLTDMVSLVLALLAIYLSGFPATDTRTYGWHRSEVFAAFINGSVLVLISGMIVYEAIHRMIAPEPVEGIGMLVAASFGIVMNLFVVHKLKGHGEHDLNMRGALLHVIGDVLISAGVVVGGVIIYFTGWYMVDPILSIIFSLVILGSSARLIYESAHIFLEGTPRGIEIADVLDEIKKVDDVLDVHRMHVWSICSNISALSAHVMINPEFKGSRKRIVDDINCRLASCFHITHTTLQLEKVDCGLSGVVCDITHCDIKHPATRRRGRGGLPVHGEHAGHDHDHAHGGHEHAHGH